MRMQDKSLIDKINPTFIALTATAIHHCLLAWKIGKFRVPLEFGLGGGAQCKCNSRNINHAIINASTEVFGGLDVDFCSSSPEVQAKKIDNIRSMFHQGIHSTGMDPAMAQSHNNQASFNEGFLDYVLEELIEQPDNCFICLSSFVAATEACMQFSAVLPMGWSAMASSSQPVPCSDSNSNSDNNTNVTSVENTGLVDESTIVKGAMSLGGYEWCQ